MGDADQHRVLSLLEFDQNFADFIRVGGIQTTSWLIGQNQFGIQYQCPGDCHSLAFTPRLFSGKVAGAILQTDLLQQPFGSFDFFLAFGF